MFTILALSALCSGVALAQDGMNAPSQVHTAFAGGDGGKSSAPDGLSVMWATSNSTSTSTLRYGKGQKLEHSVSGTQRLFWKTWLHEAHVVGLEPDTEYSYQVGDSTGGWSDVYTFTTAPSSTTRAFSIGVLADMGINHVFEQGYATRQLLSEWVAQKSIEWTLHAGDISYADDFFLVDPLKLGYADIWNTYQAVMENVTAPMAYMTCPGNHEAECHSPACDLESGAAETFNNFSAYNARFRMPSAESGGVENMWWSMAYGAASFIFIDSETDFPGAPGDSYNLRPNGNFGDQLKWFEMALQRANSTRATRPWIIVSGHRPVYSLDACNDAGVPVGAAADFQKAFEHLLLQYKVDLYLAGHVHGSELSYPTRNNVPIQKHWNGAAAPTYAIIGGAGNIEGLTNYTHDPQNVPWNAYVNGNDEILCKLTVSPQNLTLQYFISQTAALDHQVVITK